MGCRATVVDPGSRVCEPRGEGCYPDWACTPGLRHRKVHFIGQGPHSRRAVWLLFLGGRGPEIIFPPRACRLVVSTKSRETIRTPADLPQLDTALQRRTGGAASASVSPRQRAAMHAVAVQAGRTCVALVPPVCNGPWDTHDVRGYSPNSEDPFGAAADRRIPV